jgi:uncharacterized protein (TIGR04255 family)
MSFVDDPLSDVVPEEVHLKYAPLISVLAQLRFPAQPQFDQRETVAAFFEALRGTYPVVREEQIRGIAFQAVQLSDPSKAVEAKAWTIWRLSDVTNSWRLSLSRDFLTLESSAYLSHGDFIQRWGVILEAFHGALNPAVVDRFGLRYVDRIKNPALLQLPKLIRSEMLGVLGISAASKLLQSYSESIFELAPDRLVARWGQLAPTVSYDPGTITPLSEPSWVLDLDMFREMTRPFNPRAIADEANAYAQKIYTFFRWVVTPAFLVYFNEHEK